MTAMMKLLNNCMIDNIVKLAKNIKEQSQATNEKSNNV